MRKLICLIILIQYSVYLFPQAVKIGNLYYVLNESTMTAKLPAYKDDIQTGNGNYYRDLYQQELSGHVEIPYSVVYNEKTYIVDFSVNNLFENCNNITSVFVDTKNVPAYSFRGCANLTSIVFGENVEAVGDMSIGNMQNKLENITFKGNKISTIPDNFLSADGQYKTISFEKTPLPANMGNFFNNFQNSSGVSFVVPEGAELPDSWKGHIPNGVTITDPKGNTYDKNTGEVTGGGGSSGGGSGNIDPVITPTHRDYIGDAKVVDTNPATFPNVESGKMEEGQVQYTRTFSNAVDWQATYLPFTMSYDDWKDQLKVAKLMNIHRYDTNGDGTNDAWLLEIKEVTSGETKANYPYVISPIDESNLSVDITTAKSKIYPRKTDTEVTCWSTEVKYSFHGIVEDFNDWAGARSDGSELFIVNSGELRKIPASATAKLRAFRWFMKMKSTDDEFQMATDGVSSIQNVRFRVVGSDITDNTSYIATTESETHSPVEYYNVNGTRLDSPKSGMNIVKMNDGSIKKLLIK